MKGSRQEWQSGQLRRKWSALPRASSSGSKLKWAWTWPGEDRKPLVTPNCLVRSVSVRATLDVNDLRTFSKVTDPLTIDRRAIIVDIGHQELSEMSDNRPPDALVGNPFSNGLRFDVAELFERDLLKTMGDKGRTSWYGLKELTSSTPSRSSISRRSSYCLLVRRFICERIPPSPISSSSMSSDSRNPG